GVQPQIRYAPTTSQTKRLRATAQVPHGKPLLSSAWTTSSAVCASQPMRTPHIASRPDSPGPRSSPAYANAASLYAINAGQTRSSAIGATPARQLGELSGL